MIELPSTPPVVYEYVTGWQLDVTNETDTNVIGRVGDGVCYEVSVWNGWITYTETEYQLCDW